MSRSGFFTLFGRAVIVAVTVGVLCGGLAACGQRGPLFYPDPANPDKRR
jgi:predicted small lipoprotein YifL